MMKAFHGAAVIVALPGYGIWLCSVVSFSECPVTFEVVPEESKDQVDGQGCIGGGDRLKRLVRCGWTMPGRGRDNLGRVGRGRGMAYSASISASSG